MSAAASPLAQRLEQVQERIGSVYDTYAAATAADSVARKKLDRRTRARLQQALTVDLGALYRDVFAAEPVRVSAAELEVLLRLLPSMTALAALPTSDTPLLLIVARALPSPSRDGAAATLVSDVAVDAALEQLTRLLHHPERWSTGATQETLAIRATAAGVLARLLRYHCATAEEAAVEAQWRRWQEAVSHALLDELHSWVAELEAVLAQPANDAAHKRPSALKKSASSTAASLSAAAVAALLCQLLSLATALAEHPCARSLPSEAWSPLLASAVSVMGPPQEATRRLELAYTALSLVLAVRRAGVVSLGVWREVGLEVVAKAVPRGAADAPLPLPVSPLSSNAVSYASLVMSYVRLVKELALLEVEESVTDSDAVRSTARQLHTVLAGLVEVATHVSLEQSESTAEAPTSAEARVSLLPVVVKDLLSVRGASRSSPRQYARYVHGMLVGRAPLVPCIATLLAGDCQTQAALLASPRGPTVLNANAEILQGVYLWAIHATVDEGLLATSHRTQPAADLPWDSYDAADVAVGGLTVRLADVLLACPALCARAEVAVLAARIVACEGLALLLHLLLFVVRLHGVADDVSWNVRYRERLYAAEERVLRAVAAFDCGSPPVLTAFTDALDQASALLGPTAAKVGALLPSSSRPSLAAAGCQGALEKLMEVIPIF
ncbi:hypothetical protein NESM_000124300 [Novymonas esmeraldas]|uniref:Uncharacterized protein n=1 Tax=Novymonas esmeraldas TaxID=1808958 RepID=A0AAW0F4T3_9TRYP